MSVDISLSMVIVGAVGLVISVLLGIAAFGIKGSIEGVSDNLRRIEKTVDLLFSKLEGVMPIPQCENHHKAHEDKHRLEKENVDERLDFVRNDVNGLGIKLENHIQRGHDK